MYYTSYGQLRVPVLTTPVGSKQQTGWFQHRNFHYIATRDDRQ